MYSHSKVNLFLTLSLSVEPPPPVVLSALPPPNVILGTNEIEELVGGGEKNCRSIILAKLVNILSWV